MCAAPGQLLDPPCATGDLPGTAGVLRLDAEDFEVEEIPSYPPSGVGEHCFLWIEKRDLTTAEAVARVGRALGVGSNDIGVAGQKDRHALTRQMLSVPRIDPERALDLLGNPDGKAGLRVLAASRHQHKLRTGHLRGNRFRIVLRDVQGDARTRAEEILERLSVQGMPNFFGRQRFGAAGDTALPARAWLRGEAPPPRDRGFRRLSVSALQAELFNHYLLCRMEGQSYLRVIAGDILQKTDTFGIFTAGGDADGLAEAQARLEARAVVQTGPIYGSRMRRPEEGSEAARLEDTVLSEQGLTMAAFGHAAALAEGTRRALRVPVGDTRVCWLGDAGDRSERGDRSDRGEPNRRGDEIDRGDGQASAAGLVLSFSLPAGAYATVLLREVTKTAGGDVRAGTRPF